jgi:hypothetical protein
VRSIAYIILIDLAWGRYRKLPKNEAERHRRGTQDKVTKRGYNLMIQANRHEEVRYLLYKDLILVCFLLFKQESRSKQVPDRDIFERHSTPCLNQQHHFAPALSSIPRNQKALTALSQMLPLLPFDAPLLDPQLASVYVNILWHRVILINV